MKRYICLILLFTLFWGCSSLIPNNSNEPYVFIYPDASEKAALYYSGELYPPKELSTLIDRDLTLITSTWQDSISSLNIINFATPWYINGIGAIIDSLTIFSMLDSSNSDWNQLSEELDLYISSYRRGFTIEDYFVSIRSNKTTHPVELAKYFVEFPGLNKVYTSEMPKPLGPHFLIRFEENQRHYFFINYTYPDIYHNYNYFTVRNNNAVHKGFHSEHLIGFVETYLDSIPIDSFAALDRFIVDSLEANRPLWVDTVRMYDYEIIVGDYFLWNRDE